MKFMFGDENSIYDIAPFGDVKVPLSKVPKNHYIKVAAALQINNKWMGVYKTTWVLTNDYRGMFIMRYQPGSDPPRLLKERVSLAGFGEKPDRPRWKPEDYEGNDDDDDD